MATLRRAEWQPPVVLLNSGRERSPPSSEEEGDKLEDKWRLQARILMAESMFRQISVRRSDKERLFMETTLKSALHSLISAQRKVGEGQNVSSVLDEQIKELAKKLADLQRLSKKTRTKRRDPELLRPRSIDVETLTRKMESMSEGTLLKKMEDEYGSMLTRTASSSAANSQRYDPLDLSFSSLPLQPQGKNEKICAGKCKVIVRRIMEQVRAETEQWSEMQKMVRQVRQEMEHLQASRDFWERRALHSDSKIQSLNASVKEWKQRALTLEIKGKHQEDETWRKERGNFQNGIHKGSRKLQSPNRQPLRNIGNCT